MESNNKVRANKQKQEVYIYVGTQTGTADTMARTLKRDMRNLGFVAKIINLTDFKP